MPAASVARAAPGLPAPAAALAGAIVLAIGCRPPPDAVTGATGGERYGERHATPGAGGPPAPDRVRFDRPAMVRFHMQRHFDDLRTIERRLIAGKLDEARALAHLLARPAPDPGVAPWRAEYQQVIDAALALASASSIDQACRREPRVSVACANCHLRTQPPMFGPPPQPPPDLPTYEARMARHLWATDRLWEAMIGPSEPAWHGGLEVLAATPLPFAPNGTAELARHLQDLARDQRSRATTLDDRAAAYGEMLVTCAACHARIASPRVGAAAP